MKTRLPGFLVPAASITLVAACLTVPGNTAAAAGLAPSTTNTVVSAPAPPPPPPPNAPAAPALAYGVTEVLKMTQGGISKDLIINYINNTALPYHLTADNIIYLQSVGIPQEIIKTLISRDGQLQQEAVQYYQRQQQQMAAATYASPQDATAQPPPVQTGAQVVIPPSPPPYVPYDAVDYPAPYYYGWYPYYYGPSVIIGGGWGWGWHGGYHGGYHGGGFHGGYGGGGGHGGGHR